MKIKVIVLAILVGLYHFIDKCIQLLRYDQMFGMPKYWIDLLSNDLLLGSRPGKSLSGFPKEYLISLMIFWLLFLIINVIATKKQNLIWLKLLILFSALYSFYLFTTIIYLILEIGVEDLYYFMLIFLSRLVSLGIFIFLIYKFRSMLKLDSPAESSTSGTQ